MIKIIIKVTIKTLNNIETIFVNIFNNKEFIKQR